MGFAAVAATADLLDEHGDRAAVCELQLRRFGGTAPFSGPIQTVQCFEDNVLLRQELSTPGARRVLVVDGGGSLRCALIGEQVATLARDNGWSGIVLNAAVRDAAALREVGLGVDAVGMCPRRSSKTVGGQVGRRRRVRRARASRGAGAGFAHRGASRRSLTIPGRRGCLATGIRAGCAGTVTDEPV